MTVHCATGTCQNVAENRDRDLNSDDSDGRGPRAGGLSADRGPPRAGLAPVDSSERPVPALTGRGMRASETGAGVAVCERDTGCVRG